MLSTYLASALQLGAPELIIVLLIGVLLLVPVALVVAVVALWYFVIRDDE